MNYWETDHTFNHNGEQWYFSTAKNTAEAGRLETASRVLFVPFTAKNRFASPYRWLVDSHKTPIWKGFPRK